jgi:hypothetical protein
VQKQEMLLTLVEMLIEQCSTQQGQQGSNPAQPSNAQPSKASKQAIQLGLGLAL